MTEDIKQFVGKINKQPKKRREAVLRVLNIASLVLKDELLRLETKEEPLRLETKEEPLRLEKPNFLKRLKAERTKKRNRWFEKAIDIESRIVEKQVPDYLVDEEKARWKEIEGLVKDLPELKEYKEQLIKDGNSAENTLDALTSQIFINEILDTRPDLRKHLRSVGSDINLNELIMAFEVEDRIESSGPERAKKVEELIAKRQKTYQDTLPSDILDEMKQARL